MIELLLLLILLTCLGLTAAWLAENPGSVTMHWLDYQVDTSFAFLFLLFLASGYVVGWGFLLLRGIFRAPQTFAHGKSLRHHRRALAELTHSVVALAAADVKTADIHTRKAEKLLGRTPLTLLLSAQVARQQGDDVRTQVLLEQMLEHKETEYLAARYLSESATKLQQLPRARELAERAGRLNPQGLSALLSLHIRMGEWQQAAILLGRAVRKGQLTRQELRHYQALLHTQQAIELLEEGMHGTALAAARRATVAQPGFAHAQQAYAQALIATGGGKKAVRQLLSWWKLYPSLILGDALRQAVALLPREKRLAVMRRLSAIKPDAYETHITVAQAAIHSGEWRMAHDALKKALGLGDTALACKLMAEVEQGEYADFDASARWLTRAAAAEAAPAWTCSGCGRTARSWSAHCISCHSFDSLEWKSRTLAYAGE